MGGPADRRKPRPRPGYPLLHALLRRIPNCADACPLVWFTAGKRTDFLTISPFRFGRSRVRSWGCCLGACAEHIRSVVAAAQPECLGSRADARSGKCFDRGSSRQEMGGVRLDPAHRRRHRGPRAFLLSGLGGPRASSLGRSCRSPGGAGRDPAPASEPNPLRSSDPHRVEGREFGRFRALPKFRRSAAGWRIVVTATFSRLTAPVEEFESHEQG